jgi:hypothetical protein
MTADERRADQLLKVDLFAKDGLKQMPFLPIE